MFMENHMFIMKFLMYFFFNIAETGFDSLIVELLIFRSVMVEYIANFMYCRRFMLLSLEGVRSCKLLILYLILDQKRKNSENKTQGAPQDHWKMEPM